MACLSLRHETSPAASGQVFMPPPNIPALRGPREEGDQMYPYMLCETQALSWEKGDSQWSGAGGAQAEASFWQCLFPLYIDVYVPSGREGCLSQKLGRA